MSTQIVAAVCIAWYVFIVCVCSIGYLCLYVSSTLPAFMTDL